MLGKIERFQIVGLHGYKNFDLHLTDNTIILVGENGTGKTTVLRLLYYLLSAQWGSLARYKFEELIVSISGSEYKLRYELLEKHIAKIDHTLLRKVPPPFRHKFIELLEHSEGRVVLPELEALCDKFDIPLHYVLRELDLSELSLKEQDKNLVKLFSKIRASLDAQILYLPTYRRIEQELNLIFTGVDDDEWRHNRRRFIAPRERDRTFVELIEFGMKDVERAVESCLVGLKEFARENLNTLTLGYLGDVVDKKYSKVKVQEIQNASEETIKSVLDRIPESILSKSHKDHLFKRINDVRQGGKLDEHAKVICHYFLKLMHFQEELRGKESQMTNFCEVCNQYMTDKRFDYDSAEFKFSIKANGLKENKRDIELRHLSSGEKQIVSLFSHLYLSGEKNYFVLIDEPELSLSVPWQRRFLTDIKNGGFCAGLVAVTHSPFIYDNELKTYAHGLGEFEV